MANTDLSEWKLLSATDFSTVVAILPTSNSHLYLELSDVGTGELKLPLDSAAAALVDYGMFCQCFYRGSSRGGFFISNIAEAQADRSEGGGRWMSISGRGALEYLEDGMVESDGTTNTTRAFTGTAAGILITLIVEAQALSVLGSLTYDFTAVVDTDGVAWTDSEPITLNVGTSLLDVVRQFTEVGIEFDINLVAGSFVLSAYKNEIGSDKSATEIFRIGTNCTEVKEDTKGNDLKNSYLVAWRDGYTGVSDPTSIINYRKRRKLLDIKQAQSPASALTYAAATLVDTKNPQLGISVQIYDGVPPMLFEDYGVGDYIMLDRFGVMTKYRIYGIQADFDGVNYSNVVVELNTIMRTKSMKMSHDLDWLLNQWNTARDAKQLLISYWAALGNSDDSITSINAVVVQGTKVFVGGKFTRIGGVNTNNVAMYDTVTGKWDGLGGGTNSVDYVFCLASDGTNIYMGGAFTQVGGVLAANIAKWDGSVWTEVGGGVRTFAPYGYECLVNSIAITGTSLYLSGHFEQANNTDTIDQLALYDTAAHTWTNLTGSGVVYSYGVILLDGATVYLGGELTPFIKKYSSSTWSDVGAGLDERVYTLVKNGSNILAGGNFTGHIAEWDGTAWAVFGGGVNGIVRGLAIYLTDVYAVGSFTDASNYIARYSGGGWYALDTGLNNDAYAIALIDQNVIAGGIFTTAGDKSALMIAEYFNNFPDLMNYLENSSVGGFDMGAAIHNAPASAVTDSDELPFWEDVSQALRKITWANIKATLKTYLDGLYVALTGNQTVAGIKSFSSALVAGNHAVELGGIGDVEMFAPDGENPAVIQHAFGGVPGFIGRTSDGTEATPVAVPAGKVLFNIAPYGYNGSGQYINSHLKAVAAEEYTATNRGSKWELWGTPIGSTTEALIATFNSGSIDIPTGSTYDINGTPHTHAGGGGGDISGTGVVGQVAEFVTDTKTLQAAKIIGPVANILTITNAAAATLGLNITAGKTLTLTATDNFNLGIPASGTAALLEIANVYTAIQKINVNSVSAFIVEQTGVNNNVLAIDTTNGRVGINTSNPATALDVYVSALAGQVRIGYSDNLLYIASPAATKVAISFAQTGQGIWRVGIPASSSNLHFDPSSVDFSSSKLVIQSDGKIGIGILIPTATLHVEAASASQKIKSTTGTNTALLQFLNTGGQLLVGLETSAGGGAIVGGLAYAGVINQQTATALQLGTNNTARLTILSAGLIGIGNTAPTARFQVDGLTDIVQLEVTGFTTQAVATPIIQFIRNDVVAGVSALLGLTALGSGAAGDGGSILLAGKDSTTAASPMGLIDWRYIVATHASYTTAVRIYARDATAARLGIEIEASGSAAKLGFFGHATALQPAAYTPTNVTTDRSYDANSTTLDEVSDVLGTLIADLQSIGLIG